MQVPHAEAHISGFDALVSLCYQHARADGGVFASVDWIEPIDPFAEPVGETVQLARSGELHALPPGGPIGVEGTLATPLWQGAQNDSIDLRLQIDGTVTSGRVSTATGRLREWEIAPDGLGGWTLSPTMLVVDVTSHTINAKFPVPGAAWYPNVAVSLFFIHAWIKNLIAARVGMP
jgi:hypothetical protein